MTMWSSGSQEPRTIVGDVQVRRGMGDGDPSTRAEARKAYWAFGDAFRFLPDSLFIIRFPTNMLWPQVSPPGLKLTGFFPPWKLQTLTSTARASHRLAGVDFQQEHDDDLYIIGAVNVCQQKSLFVYSKNLFPDTFEFKGFVCFSCL